MASLLSEVISMNREPHSPAIIGFSQWLRLLLGLVLVFGLFHGAASALASDRGQAGLFIGVLVVTATFVVERALFQQRGFVAARTLGLGLPRAIGLIAAIAIGFLLSFVIFMFVQVRGASFAFFPGWVSLVGGLFAQAGIAEDGGDTLFPLVWMLASALLPLLALVVARPDSA